RSQGSRLLAQRWPGVPHPWLLTVAPLGLQPTSFGWSVYYCRFVLPALTSRLEFRISSLFRISDFEVRIFSRSPSGILPLCRDLLNFLRRKQLSILEPVGRNRLPGLFHGELGLLRSHQVGPRTPARNMGTDRLDRSHE